MTKDTITTKIIAPINDGIIAIPAICGPHDPNRPSPKAEPTIPATILLIQPIDLPFFVSAPAIIPIIAPTIKTHNQCIKSLLEIYLTLQVYGIKDYKTNNTLKLLNKY